MDELVVIIQSWRLQMVGQDQPRYCPRYVGMYNYAITPMVRLDKDFKRNSGLYSLRNILHTVSKWHKHTLEIK